MSVSITQLTAGTASSLLLDRVPPGATVILTTSATSADLAWGSSSAVTYSTGALVPTYAPMVFTNPVTAREFDIWVIAGTGSHAVSALVVTPGQHG